MAVRLSQVVGGILVVALAVSCQQGPSASSVGVQRLAEETEAPEPEFAEEVVDLPPPESVEAAGLEVPKPAPVDPWLPYQNVAERMGASNVAVISARVLAHTVVERSLPSVLNAMGDGVATRIDVEVEETLCGSVSKGGLAVWHEGGSLPGGRGYATSTTPVLPTDTKAVLWLVQIEGDWFLYLGNASVFTRDETGSFRVDSIAGRLVLSRTEIKQGGCP